MALGEGLGRLLPSGVKTAATGAEDASGFARPSATSSAARKSPGANTTTDAPHIAGERPRQARQHERQRAGGEIVDAIEHDEEVRQRRYPREERDGPQLHHCGPSARRAVPRAATRRRFPSQLFLSWVKEHLVVYEGFDDLLKMNARVCGDYV